MKYYVFIRLIECTDTDEVYHAGNWKKISDFHYELDNCYTYRRPIDLRGPDELTDEELQCIRGVLSSNNESDYKNIRLALDVFEKLRARPRETEKEKWIKQKVKNIPFDCDTPLSSILSDTWDAAYEAGRKDI